jgi:hypothetical protein
MGLKLRSVAKAPGADLRPVLIITNLDTPEAINQAFSAGASDYLTKPIQWPVLRQRVRWMVRAGQAEEVFRKIYDELVQVNTVLREEREARQQAEALAKRPDGRTARFWRRDRRLVGLPGPGRTVEAVCRACQGAIGLGALRDPGQCEVSVRHLLRIDTGEPPMSARSIYKDADWIVRFGLLPGESVDSAGEARRMQRRRPVAFGQAGSQLRAFGRPKDRSAPHQRRRSAMRP